jgi:hypothetical protein
MAEAWVKESGDLDVNERTQTKVCNGFRRDTVCGGGRREATGRMSLREEEEKKKRGGGGGERKRR